MRIQNPESRIQKGKKERAGLTFEERMALVIVSLALLLFLAFFGSGCSFIRGIDSGTRTFGITNRIQNSEFRIHKAMVLAQGAPMELSFDQAVLGTNGGVRVYCRSGNDLNIFDFASDPENVRQAVQLPLDRSRPWMVSATTFTNRPFPILDQFTNEDGSPGFLTNGIVESDPTAALLGCSSDCLPGIVFSNESVFLSSYGRADSTYQVELGTNISEFSFFAEFQGTNGAWSVPVSMGEDCLFFKTQRIGPP